VVVCLERGADLHMAQLMPLPLTASVKSRLVFTFLVPALPGSPGKRAVKWLCVCVCVCVCVVPSSQLRRCPTVLLNSHSERRFVLPFLRRFINARALGDRLSPLQSSSRELFGGSADETLKPKDEVTPAGPTSRAQHKQ